MIVILDTAKGQALNFKTRKDAGEFLGVSLPTLRKWLSVPFFMYETFIITKTDNEKVNKANRQLVKMVLARSRQAEIERVAKIHIQGVLYPDRINGNSSPRPKQTPTNVDAT